MDEGLPLESYSDASFRALVAHERAKRAEAEQNLARLQADIARQNERILALERENAEMRGTERPAKHQRQPWPSERTKREREPKVRKRRDQKHNHGRQRMDRVD